MAKHGLWIGAIFGLLSVVLGSFGAHGLQSLWTEMDPEELADRLANWETGNRYYVPRVGSTGRGHDGAIQSPSRSRVAMLAIAAGTVVFSGFLYLIVLSGQDWMGMIVPLGGVDDRRLGSVVLAGWTGGSAEEKKKS